MIHAFLITIAVLLAIRCFPLIWALFVTIFSLGYMAVVGILFFFVNAFVAPLEAVALLKPRAARRKEPKRRVHVANSDAIDWNLLPASQSTESSKVTAWLNRIDASNVAPRKEINWN
jgi:predicted RND superfamily exporter protein